MERGKHRRHHNDHKSATVCLKNYFSASFKESVTPLTSNTAVNIERTHLTLSHTVAVLAHLLTDLIPDQRHIFLQLIQLHTLLLQLLLVTSELPLQLCKKEPFSKNTKRKWGDHTIPPRSCVFSWKAMVEKLCLENCFHV